MSAPEACSRCGEMCAPAGSGHSLPLLARSVTGAMYCQSCAADIERSDLIHRRLSCAYIDSDAAYLTTWAGEPLARITRTSSSCAGFNGSEILAWRAVTPTGIRLYGRNAGRGMCTRIRYVKV